MELQYRDIWFYGVKSHWISNTRGSPERCTATFLCEDIFVSFAPSTRNAARRRCRPQRRKQSQNNHNNNHKQNITEWPPIKIGKSYENIIMFAGLWGCLCLWKGLFVTKFLLCATYSGVPEYLFSPRNIFSMYRWDLGSLISKLNNFPALSRLKTENQICFW